MAWNPIIVGVDGSTEAACAVALGDYVARRANTTCRLIHVASDLSVAMSTPEAAGLLNQADLVHQAELAARRLVEQSLAGVPVRLRDSLEVQIGRPSVVLTEAAEACQAEAIVMGCKHRRALARLAGSTIPHVVRRGAVPVLATDRQRPEIARILVAVDLSWAAKPTIDAALRWASLLGASVRVVHAVEPVPVVPGISLPVGNEQFFRTTEQAVERAIGPMLEGSAAQLVVRRGRAAAAITTEAEQWRADLLVVGSHGKGWVDRLLIGSTSERLLHVLPAPMLVVPVAHQAGVAGVSAASAAFAALAVSH